MLPWMVEVDDDGEQGPITAAAAAAGDEEGSIAAAEVYLGGGVGLTIFRDDTPAIGKGILESIFIKLKVFKLVQCFYCRLFFVSHLSITNKYACFLDVLPQKRVRDLNRNFFTFILNFSQFLRNRLGISQTNSFNI